MAAKPRIKNLLAAPPATCPLCGRPNYALLAHDELAKMIRYIAKQRGHVSMPRGRRRR